MNNDTLLYRQVNPSWIQSGRITSQVFKPTTKDNNRLSVYDGDQTTAEGSWKHYTEELGYASTGVCAVSIAECQTFSLPVAADPTPFPSHVLIDFNGCSNSQIDTKAKLLKRHAESRGWQYQAGQN